MKLNSRDTCVKSKCSEHYSQNGSSSKKAVWYPTSVVKLLELLINIPMMNAVWRERRELEKLTDRHIADIGLNPDDVRKECNRQFFDIPINRKRMWNQRHRLPTHWRSF